MDLQYCHLSFDNRPILFYCIHEKPGQARQLVYVPGLPVCGVLLPYRQLRNRVPEFGTLFQHVYMEYFYEFAYSLPLLFRPVDFSKGNETVGGADCCCGINSFDNSKCA
jgi:hypothetical protein